MLIMRSQDECLRLLKVVADDSRHPLNRPGHPRYDQARKAWTRLLKYINQPDSVGTNEVDLRRLLVGASAHIHRQFRLSAPAVESPPVDEWDDFEDDTNWDVL